MTPTRASTLCFVFALGTPACVDEPPAPQPTKVEDQGFRNRLGQPQKPPTDPQRVKHDPAVSGPENRKHAQLPAEEVERLVAEGRAALAAGNTSVATQRFLQCANRIPGSARCDGELGLAFAGLATRRAEAKYYLEAALTLEDPAAEPELFERLADTFRSLRERELALTAIDRALAIERTPDRLIIKARILQIDAAGVLPAVALYAEARHTDDRIKWLQEEAVLRAQVADELPRARALFVELAGRLDDNPAQQARVNERIKSVDAAIANVAAHPPG